MNFNKFYFILGMILGFILTSSWVIILPFHWVENQNFWNKTEKLEGKIIIVIGYDDKLEHTYESSGLFNSKLDQSTNWNEYKIAAFKDKQRAIWVRRKIMKELENASSNYDGK